MKKDGHIHTPFCPHGTKDSLSEYVERALELRFEEISFTEHAPLPKGFVDSTPTKDSAMSVDELTEYFSEIDIVKNKYKGKIKINAGLEVDYIEGFEEETTAFLNNVGKFIDDAILSVHFLKYENDYDCVDYSPNLFAEMVQKYGTVESIYKNYYRTVLKSINANLGKYKPKRIGHITLVKKFQHKFKVNVSFANEISKILLAIKKNNLQLDYNGAGVAKPLCLEPYPPLQIAKQAKALNIPLVYGSDAHQIKDLGQGRDIMLF